MNTQKRKMRFLATKLAALQSELQVSKEIFQLASAEVDKMFIKKYYPEHPVEQEKDNSEPIKEYSEEEAEKNKTTKTNDEQYKRPDPEDFREQDSATKVADPEVKKMFKKIAHQCHPDKLQDLEEGYEKSKKSLLYQKAREALENNDAVCMANVAQDLGIEVPEVTEAQLKQTEQKIISIKKELSMIESTAVWHWFFTEDADKKDKILEQLFEVMYGINKPNPRT